MCVRERWHSRIHGLRCGHLVQVFVAGLLEDWLEGLAGKRAEEGLGDRLQGPGVGTLVSETEKTLTYPWVAVISSK